MTTPNSQVTEQARKVQRELIEWEQQMPRVWYGNRTLLDAHNIIEDLLAAIEAALTARTEARPQPAQGDGWLPIESAPRDELVLVYDYRKNQFSVGGVYKFTYATHWRPLPPPLPPSSRGRGKPCT